MLLSFQKGSWGRYISKCPFLAGNYFIGSYFCRNICKNFRGIESGKINCSGDEDKTFFGKHIDRDVRIKEVAKMHAEGMSYSEIAQKIGCTRQNVHIIILQASVLVKKRRGCGRKNG